jgi:CheY-like chemotaxis protein
VLLVDDDGEGRGALAELLEDRGYTVRQAENGRVALDRIAERLPCVLLLDLEMPVMDGWEVLASLRRAGALAAMTVVVLSAHRSAPAGVPFVAKPCGADDLLAMLAPSRDRHGDSATRPASHP